MPTLIERSNELDQKRGELAAKFAEARNDDGSWKDITSDQQAEFIRRNDEIKSLADSVESLRRMEETARQNDDAMKSSRQPNRQFEFGPGGKQDDAAAPQVKSLGQMFVDSQAYKNRKDRGRSPIVVDMVPQEMKDAFLKSQRGEGGSTSAMKTLMTTSAGLAPYPPRQAEIVPFPNRQPVVADLIPQQDTDAPSIIYLEITTFTRNAAAVAEGGQKPEDALSGTQRIVPMTKVATTLPVTEEQMDDLPGIRDFIDSALRVSVLLEEDRELLLGSGSSPEMTGFLNKSGVNTGAKSTDDIFTAAHKALTAIRTVGFAMPSGYVMNPTDWESFETAKDSTGRFILGDPGQQTDKRLWGLPVVDTVVMTQGTILAGDFRNWSKIWRKMELRIDAGWVANQFLLNEMTIRAEERLALQITRPSAFATRSGF
jgi:HK97 family phage major capsid protein